MLGGLPRDIAWRPLDSLFANHVVAASCRNGHIHVAALCKKTASYVAAL